MSVVLSIRYLLIFSMTYMEYEALQIGRFRHSQQDGVVFCLAALLYQPQATVSVYGGGGDGFQEIGLADVIGTGASHQRSTRPQHLEGPQIQLFIPSQRRIQGLLGTGKCGRIEDNGVVLFSGSRIVF